MMAYVASGRNADARALLKMVEVSTNGDNTNAMMSREVALPLCQALIAFGAGNYQKCVGLIEAVRPHSNRFGGSNAQRDVIGLTQVRGRTPRWVGSDGAEPGC